MAPVEECLVKVHEGCYHQLAPHNYKVLVAHSLQPRTQEEEGAQDLPQLHRSSRPAWAIRVPVSKEQTND